jgi:hypothetical protein
VQAASSLHGFEEPQCVLQYLVEQRTTRDQCDQAEEAQGPKASQTDSKTKKITLFYGKRKEGSDMNQAKWSFGSQKQCVKN